MSVGCAVKANNRLSFNAGGSYLFGGQADYRSGSLSNVAGRAGLIFKLGNIQTSNNNHEQLKSRLDAVQDANRTTRNKIRRLKQGTNL